MKKSTGVFRCIDELGRIVIPKSMRNKLGINSGDSLEFRMDEDCIIISPDKSRCAFCGGTDGLYSFKGKSRCGRCISELSEIKN